MRHDQTDSAPVFQHRRKGSPKQSRRDGSFSFCMIALGSITWGLAIYSLKGQVLAPGSCMALGAGVSLLLGSVWRRMYLVSNLILPLLIVGYICRTY